MIEYFVEMTRIRAELVFLLLALTSLSLPAQTVADSTGVHVHLNDAPLIHGAPIFYPMEALKKATVGTVVVQVKLDANGEVSKASFVSGPKDLRGGVLEAVQTWHFEKSAALSTRRISIDFSRPDLNDPRTTAIPPLPVKKPMVNGPVARVESIGISGLSDAAAAQLKPLLTIQAGDSVSPESLARTLRTIQQFDKHLALRITPSGGIGVTITVIPRDIADMTAGSVVVIAPDTVVVDPDTMRGNEIQEVKPVYPPLAQLAGQEGTVRLEIAIGKSGRVQEVKPVFGPPLLVPSAVEAVKQWTWNPVVLLGRPAEVVTTVDIRY